MGNKWKLRRYSDNTSRKLLIYPQHHVFLTSNLLSYIVKVNDELCRSYGIKRSITSAYHPQTNGLAERTNSTFKTRIAKLCNDRLSNWPDFIEEVAYSLRTQKQRSTGFTPFHLMFGREHWPLDQVTMHFWGRVGWWVLVQM